MRPTSFKQTNKTLQEAALETITTSSRNEPRWLKNMDDLETIVYTRGVYRPQPVYWRGANRGTGANDESRMSALQVPEHHGLNESTEDAGNRTAEESLDKSKLNGNADFDLNTSLPAKLSLSKDGDELEQRNSAFAAYNKRVTIHEDQRQPQFYGRRRGHGHGHGRRPRTRPSREEPYKAPQITEPNAVDFNKYGIVAQLWMEQVDMKTVLKSRTMYLTIMPAGAQLPDEIMKSMKHVQAGEDQSAPAQWIIARGRTIRRQKRHMDGHRMSESFFLSGADSDPDLSRSGYPMSPGKQSLLFFKVGGRWPDLAWALFEGIHTDAATLRMIKDIELKNPGRMTDQIQDMMNRWWTQKGQAATIEELRRSLELINLPFVQDETLNVTMANNFFSTSDLENKLAVEEVDAGDPEVSRMAHEYNLHSHNASFVAEHRRSPQSAQPFSSDALLRQMQQKGLLTKSQPSLRNSLLKPEDNWVSSIGRSNSRDGSFIRHQARNESLRLFSSQDSLNAENVGDDNKRKSFTIVQPKTPKNKKVRNVLCLTRSQLINSFILAISIVPLQVHYYSEALPTQHDTVSEYHSEAPQATVSGLAQGP